MTVNWRAGEKENVRKEESEVGGEGRIMCEQEESEMKFSAKIGKHRLKEH